MFHREGTLAGGFIEFFEFLVKLINRCLPSCWHDLIRAVRMALVHLSLSLSIGEEGWVESNGAWAQAELDKAASSKKKVLFILYFLFLMRLAIHQQCSNFLLKNEARWVDEDRK